MGNKDSFCPRVGLKTLRGLDDDGFEVEIEGISHPELVETCEMNPLELVCVKGFHDILKFFVNDLNLKSKSEFCSDHENLAME